MHQVKVMFSATSLNADDQKCCELKWRNIQKHSCFVLPSDKSKVAMKISSKRFVYLETDLNDDREWIVKSGDLLVIPVKILYSGD